MITPPRRSVTRFFIPLIDVLILLFAIFLLMPFVSEPGSGESPEAKATPKEALPEDVKELQRELTEARERIKRMELAAQSRLTDRLSVRVLQIDRKDGTLYYFDPERQEIRTEADALKLISRQRTLASAGGGVKDVFFLILFPPKSSYPTHPQVNQIRQWFKDVPVGFDTGLAGE